MAATLGLLIALPAAGNANVGAPCTTTISNQTLASVVVPPGATCTLNNDVITGGITDNGGTLNLTPSSTPIGKAVVFSPGSQFFESGNWAVNGNVALNDVVAFAFGPVTVGGSFAFENEPGGFSSIGNVVANSVVLENNTGGVTFGGNTVGGNIYCSGNNPAPTNGGIPNSVSGKELGQCAGLG